MSIKINISITLVTKIIILFSSFIISIIIARVLGPTQKGIYSLLILIPSFVLLSGTFGLKLANTYFIAKKDFSINKIISNSLYYIVGISLTVIIILYLANNIFHFTKSMNLYILILILIPLAISINILSGIIVGLNKIIVANKINLILRIGLLILIICLLLSHFINVRNLLISNIIVYSLGIIYILKFIKIKIRKFDTNLLSRSLKYGFKPYIANLATYFNYRIDMIFVAYLLGAKEVGFYSVSVSVGESLWIFVKSSIFALFPVSISSDKSNEITLKLCRINFSFLIILAILFAFLARWIFPILFGNQFNPSISAFIFLLPGIVFLSIGKVLSTELAGKGWTKYAMYSSLFVMVSNILLNILLIPSLGIKGAALASSISYTISSILLIIFYKKHYPDIKYKEIIIPKIDDFLDFIPAKFKKS